MTESGGGGLGARFFSGLGAIGNILRLSSGSQVNNQKEEASSSDDEEVIAVDEVAAAADAEDAEGAREGEPSDDDAEKAEEQDHSGVRYRGKLVAEMKFNEMKAALRFEGCRTELLRTKALCMEALTEIALEKERNGEVEDTPVEQPIVKVAKETKGTPAKGLKFLDTTLLSENKMSTRRSVHSAVSAAAPPSSRLRNRSPPPSSSDKKASSKKNQSKTPSKSESSVKRARGSSHLFGDEYELAGGRRAGTPSVKIVPSAKKAVPSAKKQRRAAAVDLDDLGAERGYRAGDAMVPLDDASEMEGEESEAESQMEPTRGVISRADYQLMVAAAALKEKEIQEKQKQEKERQEAEEEQERLRQLEEAHNEVMDIGEESDHAVDESNNGDDEDNGEEAVDGEEEGEAELDGEEGEEGDAEAEDKGEVSEHVEDSYKDGSGDDSFLGSDFQADTLPRDEDGAEGDGEDEEEEDEEEIYEEVKDTAPYDEVAEGDDEYENTAEEEGGEEEESEEVDEEHDEVEEDDENEEKDYGDEDEVPQSDDDSEEGGSVPGSQGMVYAAVSQECGGIVDLVSSDEEEVEAVNEEGEEGEGGEDEEGEAGNESFLTADNNEPTTLTPLPLAKVPLPSSMTVAHVASDDMKKKEEVKEAKEVKDKGDPTQEAVNMVLSAYKGRLSQRDFEQLQLIMGRDSHAEDAQGSVAAAVTEQSSSSAVMDRRRSDREGSRLSFEGGSWTSRESFLPPSPHDRFAPLVAPTTAPKASVPSEPLVASVSAQSSQAAKENLFAHNDAQYRYRDGGNGNNVKFNLQGMSPVEDRMERREETWEERVSIMPNGASSSHIRYGPVTFMRRPMTPFAKKTAPSPFHQPSPFHPVYEGASSSAPSGQGQGQGYQQTASYHYRRGQGQSPLGQLPYSAEEIQRKRRLEDSGYPDIGDAVEHSDAKRMRAIDGRRQEAPIPLFESRALGAPGFTPGAYQPGSGSGSSGPGSAHSTYGTYTPMFRDSSSRGSFSSILLQPSQRGVARRASLSVSQRRKFTRQSEGGSSSSSMSPSGPITSSSSAYASASVAKRILDALSELNTPMEEARQRPISVTAALSASREALAQSERAPLASILRPSSSERKGEKASSYLSFPSLSSVGPAAVAASLSSSLSSSSKPAAAAPPSTSSSAQDGNNTAKPSSLSVSSSSSSSSSAASSVAFSAPSAKHSAFGGVRFADTDSEFTFEEPSQVEGVDDREMEGLNNSDNRIKFAFSPPGKASKKRGSVGVAEDFSSSKRGVSANQTDSLSGKGFALGTGTAPLSVSFAATPAAAEPAKASLWTMAAASDAVKCPSCLTSNTKGATKCVSCESAIGSVAPFSVGASFSAPTSVPSSAPVAATEPAKVNLWAMAANSDAIKCPSCLTSNTKGSTKCVSCESILGSTSASTSAPAAPPKSDFGGVSGGFSFGTPAVASTPAVSAASAPITFVPSTAPTSASVGFSFGGAPSAAPATTAPAPAAFAGFTGFSFGAAPVTAPPAAAPTTAAKAISFSTSAATTSSSFAGFGMPGNEEKSKPITFGAAPSAAPATTPVIPAAGGFSGFGSAAAPAASSSSSAPLSFGAPTSGSFGAVTALPATAKTTPAPFAFGSVPPAAVPSATAALSVPAFSFGAPKLAAAGASASPAPFSFGAATTPAATPAVTAVPAPASGFSAGPAFTFGVPAASAVPPAAASAPFTFGASTAAAATAAAAAPSPAPFMFAAPAAAPANTTPPGSFAGIVTDGSALPTHSVHAAYGMDSPSSTMDTGYASGDASNMGFPPSHVQTGFSNGSAPFAFGAPAASANPMCGPMGSSLPPFGITSQAPFGSGSSFGAPSSQTPAFTFGIPSQPQTQPAFGSGPGIAGGAFGQQQQPMAQAAFSFGASQAQPQSQGMSGGYGGAMGGQMGMGMGQQAPSGGGGFSLGASDKTAVGMRKKVKAKRPGAQ